MEGMSRSQVDVNGMKMLEKIKLVKSSKAIKDLGNLDKKLHDSNKKKGKMRRS